MWWSPTAKYLAYVQINDTEVHAIEYAMYGNGQYPTTMIVPYPKVRKCKGILYAWKMCSLMFHVTGCVFTGWLHYSKSKAFCNWCFKCIYSFRGAGAQIPQGRVQNFFFIFFLYNNHRCINKYFATICIFTCIFALVFSLSDHYLSSVTWVTDERIAVQWLTRRQDQVLLQIYDYDGTNWNENTVGYVS